MQPLNVVHPSYSTVVPITHEEHPINILLHPRNTTEVFVEFLILFIPQWPPFHLVLLSDLLNITLFIGEGDIENSCTISIAMHKLFLEFCQIT